MATQIDITGNTSDVRQELKLLTKELAQSNLEVKEFTASTINFNASGRRTGAVLKGLTEDGQKFVSTFGQVAKTLDVNGEKVKIYEERLKKISFTAITEKAQRATVALHKFHDVLGEIKNFDATFAKAAGASGQFDAFAENFAKSNSFVKQLTSQVSHLNGQGLTTRSVIQGVTTDGRSFTATFQGMRDAANRLIIGANGVELGLKGIEFSKKTKEAQELANAHDANVEKANALSSVFGRLARAAQYFVAYRAFNLITTELNDAVAAANKLQIQMSLIRTISQGSQISRENLGKQIGDVARGSGFDVNETAQAFYDTVSNQVAKGDKIAPFVATAAELARVTGSSLTDSVNTLTSALNSYGKTAEDAERVSAILFRTIDEGRIVMSEVASTLGRVGVIGNNLGVPLEELAATLAVTTQKGFKTADSMTLLTNLLIKLEKPTEATQKLFESLGVESGEQAIKLFGFTGVIQKMVELTKAGIVPVSAFFDEIRGRKQFGIFEQSIADIDRFSDKLKDLAGTQQQYNNAKAIRAESPADSLNKQLNAAKTFATQAIGGELVAALNLAVTKANELDNALAKATGATSKDAIAALTAGVTGLGIAFGVAALRAIAFNATLLTVTRSAAALAIGLAVAAKLGEQFAKLQSRYSGRIIDEVDNENMEAFSLHLKEVAQNAKAVKQEKTGEALADGYKSALGILAQLSIKNNQVLEEVKQKAKQAADALKASFATYADSIKTGISNLKSAITSANNELEQSQRRTLQFGETVDNALFQTRFKYASSAFIGGMDSQQVKLVTAEIEKLYTKAQALYDLGDAQSVREADSLLKEIVQLNQQRFDLRQDAAQKKAEAAAKAFPSLYDPLGTGQAVRDVNTAELEEELKRAADFKSKNESRFQGQQKQTIFNAERELEIQNRKLRLFEATASKLANLTPYDQSGAVKAEFRDQTTGKFDPAKFAATRDKLFAELDALAKADETRGLATASERLKLEAAFTDFKKTQIAEIAALERKTALETIKARQEAEADAAKNRQLQLKKDQEATAGDTTQKFKQVAGGLEQLRRFEDNAASQLGSKLDAGPAGALDLNSGLTPEQQAAFGRAREKRIAANAALKSAETDLIAGPDGTLVPNPKKIEAARDALFSYINAVRELEKLVATKRQETTTLVNRDPVSGKDLTFRGVGEQNLGLLKGIEENSEKIVGRGQRNELENQRDLKRQADLVDKLKAAYPEMAVEAEKAAAKSANVFKPTNDAVDDLLKKVRELKLELQTLPGGANLKSDLGKGDLGGGEVYAATGGIVGLFPGQPRGVDIHPIWAATGERIIDSVTSSLYRPQLDAIMSRRMPRYMAQGGTVGGDTTVGDINVNVVGGPTNEGTGRSVVRGLQRQFRMKNVRF